MIDQRKRIFAVNVWLIDLILTTASFLLAYRIRTAIDLPGHTVMPIRVYLRILAVILPTWAALLPAFRVYSEAPRALVHQIRQLSKAVGLAWLVIAALQFFLNQDSSNRVIVLLAPAINYIFLVSYRIVLFRLKRHRAFDVKHLVVIGSGPSARDLARSIDKHREWGLTLMGTFEQSDVRRILEGGGVDEVIIVAENENLGELSETFILCEELGITARVALNFFPHSIARMELHELDGLPLLSFSTTPTNEVLLFVRRILDIVLAVVIAVVAAPLMVLTVLLIKVTSPGPVLFVQDRCGLNGRVFRMYKFRSMISNAEQLRSELEALNEMDGPVFKSSHDPRITLIGKFIRRFSIDELPQLYNVLRGDMSLVGPRPPLPGEVSKYERWQRRRLSMKPGITCLWQISGRNEVSFDDWMKLDLTYIDNWSLLLDLKILLKTVPVVLLGRGAK
jgi:exopolysaccharide biosynthesis polyprenyl glycosylphosphotransferase